MRRAEQKFHRTNRFTKCESPNVYIGNIPQGMNPGSLLSYLESFAPVLHLECSTEQMSGTLKGYAKAEVPEAYLKVLFAQHHHFVAGHYLTFKPWIQKNDYTQRKEHYNRRKVFVRHHPIMDQDALYWHFSRFGAIEEIDCKYNPSSLKPRNFCFITFATPDGAENAAKFGKVYTRNQKVWCEMIISKYQQGSKKSVLQGQSLQKESEQVIRQKETMTNHIIENIYPGEEPTKIGNQKQDQVVTKDNSKSVQFDSCSVYEELAFPENKNEDYFDNFSVDLEPELLGPGKKGHTNWNRENNSKMLDQETKNQGLKPTSKFYPLLKRELIDANHVETNLTFLQY